MVKKVEKKIKVAEVVEVKDERKEGLQKVLFELDKSIQETQEKIKTEQDVNALVELNEALVLLKDQRDNLNSILKK